MKASYDLPNYVRVDGGLSQNEALMQFFSDAVGMPIVAAHHHEITSFGVARTIVKNRLDHHLPLPTVDREKRFQPRGDAARRLFTRWKNHGI
jgi:glycerol kinase